MGHPGTAATQAESQTPHKDICIAFTLKDKERFEAVGFLKDGETSVTIKEACRRAGRRVVKSDKDWVLIRDNLKQLPCELLKFTWLVSKRPLPFNQRQVSFLNSVGNGWDESHCHLEENRCTSKDLVLRRA